MVLLFSKHSLRRPLLKEKQAHFAVQLEKHPGEAKAGGSGTPFRASTRIAIQIAMV